MRRILLIDDAQDIKTVVEATLGSSFLLQYAQTLEEATRLLAAGSFDLILLDVVLPDGDGYKYCATLQNSPSTAGIPVIFLTGKGEVNDRVLGFSLGADDYIVKPFEPIELRARVEARLKKTRDRSELADVLRKEDLRINTATQKVYIMESGEAGAAERQIDLTPVEYKLLTHFARHEDHVLSREQLLAAVWNDHVNVTDRSVDVHVSNLRKKISACAFTIKPVYGVGYRFARREALPKGPRSGDRAA
jgi:two-component system phosphate regulon response regulator PhoB